MRYAARAELPAMLFRLYFWSIGPVSLISSQTDLIPFELFVTIYWPILELVEHCPVVAER